MFETSLTVVGHIVNDPQRRKFGDQELIKFRVASNSRRRTADGNWEPGNSLFITVNCWGRLVGGVGAALGKGAPVIVVGHVYTSEYEDRDGNRRSSLEMRATSVGPDLSRVFVRIEKSGRLKPLNSTLFTQVTDHSPVWRGRSVCRQYADSTQQTQSRCSNAPPQRRDRH